MRSAKRRIELYPSTLIVLIVFVISMVSTVEATEECRLEPPSFTGMDIKDITIINDAGKAVVINSRIADDFQERIAGFQYVCPEVIAKEFILFVFRKPIISQFHMSNVHAPLDIAFFADNGAAVNVQTMFPYRSKGRQILYGPRLPFLYALEAREGYFAEMGISANKSRLKID